MTEIIEVECRQCGANCEVEIVSFDEVPTSPECPRCGAALWDGVATNIRINCQEPGCSNEPVVCRYPDGTETWYCETHMPKHGFCVGCDEYWGGVEEFDAYRRTIGLCPDCRMELAEALDGDPDEAYFPGLGIDTELAEIVRGIESGSDLDEDTEEIETLILEEAEVAKKRLLLNEPEYIELYRRVTFVEQGVKVEHLDTEDFESEWAEVNIPLHDGNKVYCVVCYIVGRPANEPALMAMMMLNDVAPELVHGQPGIIKLEGK